jgi:predicted nucleotidyltransferase
MPHVKRAIRPESASIIKELAAALRARYRDRYLNLLVYGSEARGEAGPHSDIDVLLILRDAAKPSREVDRIADILADFNLRYGVLLSVLPVTQEKFNKAEGPFWRNVRREGIAA